jgi:hypothetical protein
MAKMNSEKEKEKENKENPFTIEREKPVKRNV